MTTPTAQPQRADSRLVFVSYARADQDAADRIRQAVLAMHHEVWIDSTLEGGHEWWDEILGQLQRCDAVIVVVSMDLLASDAATAERSYARALGKPLIPIKVGPIRDDVLPPDIAVRQYVDFTQPSFATGIELANVLRELPTSPPLPPSLPVAPPVPRSYLSSISEMLYRPSLTDDEQRSIAGKLGDALQRPRDRETALELLELLEGRRDLYASTQRDILRIRQDLAAATQPPATVAVGPPAERHLPQPQWSGPMRAATPDRAIPSGAPPPQHLALSIVGLLVSLVGILPVGAIAVIMASQVTSRWNRGDGAGSLRASHQTVGWALAGIAWGGLALVFYVYAAYYNAYSS